MVGVLKRIFNFKFTKKKIVLFICFSFLIILSYIPLFHNLSGPSIFRFDEVYYATNSVETTLNNNFIVLTENDTVSNYNTKPPFVIWTQSFLMRIIGINEWSVRLPSAFAAFIIVIALFFFSVKLFQSKIMGFAAALVFLTSDGFITWHVERTGDLDAMLSMWLFLYCIVFIKFLITEDENYKSLFYQMAFLVIMAFLSKSIGGFMMLPGIIICALISRKRKKILSNPHLYYSVLLTITICSLYYILREALAPGFLKLVWGSEVLRFNQNVMPWHEHPFLWFIDRFIHETYKPYIFIIPFAIILGLVYPDKRIKLTVLFLTICILTYLFLISYPIDKCEWYDAPLYSYFALLVGILFYCIYQYLKMITRKKRIIAELLITLIIILSFILPYLSMYNKIEKFGKNYDINDYESIYAKKLTDEKYKINYTVFYKPTQLANPYQVNFYRKANKYNNGIIINIYDTLSQIKINDTLMVCQIDKKDSLNKYFQTEIIDNWNDCSLLVVKKSRGK